MRHEIQVEEYTREADGKRFSRVVMTDLAGSDSFKIVCTSETPQEALLQLAYRLRLVGKDANDIAGKLFERCWVPKLEEKDSLEIREAPALRLVEPDNEEGRPLRGGVD